MSKSETKNLDQLESKSKKSPKEKINLIELILTKPFSEIEQIMKDNGFAAILGLKETEDQWHIATIYDDLETNISAKIKSAEIAMDRHIIANQVLEKLGLMKKNFDIESNEILLNKTRKFRQNPPINIKIGKENYLVKSGDSAWNVFRLLFQEHDIDRYNDKLKFHISIDRNPENHQKAFDIISKILAKNKVKLFKILPKEQLEEGRGKNDDGKEFVIYMQSWAKDHESDPVFWTNLCEEIENELFKNGIKPGNSPLGDKMIDGSYGYAFVRDRNIFNNYISAETLQELCFNATESASLGDKIASSMFGKLHKESSLISESKEEKTKKPDLSIDLVTEDINPIARILAKDYDRADLWRLTLFEAEEDYNLSCFSDNYEQRFGSEFFEHFFYKWLKDQTAIYKRKNLMPYMNEILNQSSLVVAMVYKSLKASDLCKSQEDLNLFMLNRNITPAIYNYFFRAVLNNMKSKDLDIGQALQVVLQDPETLIKEIAKCGLRDSRVNQILHTESQYVLKLSSKTIDQLVDAAYKKIKEPSKEKLEKEEKESKQEKEKEEKNPKQTPQTSLVKDAENDYSKPTLESLYKAQTSATKQ